MLVHSVETRKSGMETLADFSSRTFDFTMKQLDMIDDDFDFGKQSFSDIAGDSFVCSRQSPQTDGATGATSVVAEAAQLTARRLENANTKCDDDAFFENNSSPWSGLMDFDAAEKKSPEPSTSYSNCFLDGSLTGSGSSERLSQNSSSRGCHGNGGFLKTTFSCGTCHKEFSTEKYLFMHAALHRTTIEGGRDSEDQPSSLTGGSADSQVVRTKINGAPGSGPGSQWTCKICSKTFAQNSNFKNHIRTHSDERPFACTVCSIGFKERYHLKKHILFKHSDELKEECRVCGKRFKDSTAVRAHERIHSDERPYGCLRCGKTFKTSECLWHHENRSRTCGKLLDGTTVVGCPGIQDIKILTGSRFRRGRQPGRKSHVRPISNSSVPQENTMTGEHSILFDLVEELPAASIKIELESDVQDYYYDQTRQGGALELRGVSGKNGWNGRGDATMFSQQKTVDFLEKSKNLGMVVDNRANFVGHRIANGDRKPFSRQGLSKGNSSGLHCQEENRPEVVPSLGFDGFGANCWPVHRVQNTGYSTTMDQLGGGREERTIQIQTFTTTSSNYAFHNHSSTAFRNVNPATSLGSEHFYAPAEKNDDVTLNPPSGSNQNLMMFDVKPTAVIATTPNATLWTARDPSGAAIAMEYGSHCDANFTSGAVYMNPSAAGLPTAVVAPIKRDPTAGPNGDQTYNGNKNCLPPFETFAPMTLRAQTGSNNNNGGGISSSSCSSWSVSQPSPSPTVYNRPSMRLPAMAPPSSSSRPVSDECPTLQKYLLSGSSLFPRPAAGGAAHWLTPKSNLSIQGTPRSSQVSPHNLQPYQTYQQSKIDFSSEVFQSSTKDLTLFTIQ